MADENKKQNQQQPEPSLTLNKETMDVLVAKIIPTSKYFEARFDHMQGQITELKEDMNRRFEQVDKRLEHVDRRFEDMQGQLQELKQGMDRRFEQVMGAIGSLGDKLKHRDENQRHFTLRMFTIAITISVMGVLGVLLKSLHLF